MFKSCHVHAMFSWIRIIPLFACSVRFSCKRLGSSVPEPPRRMAMMLNLAPTLHFQEMYVSSLPTPPWMFCSILTVLSCPPPPIFLHSIYILIRKKGHNKNVLAPVHALKFSPLIKENPNPSTFCRCLVSGNIYSRDIGIPSYHQHDTVIRFITVFFRVAFVQD